MSTVHQETCAEWLAAWDRGEAVWSVEMGGLGPGYEQVIQILAAECLRFLLSDEAKDLRWVEEEDRIAANQAADEHMMDHEAASALGPSGAQMGAAKNLAAQLFFNGPAKALSHPSLDKDRLIRVQKDFPSVKP